MKKFIAGFLTCALIMGTVTVFGESVTKAIEAQFGAVKLVVDGKPVDKETLLYDGTTYVPLRAAAEMLGKEVAWDGSTDTAYIDPMGTGRTFGEEAAATPVAPTPTPTVTATPTATGKGTYANPHGLNEIFTMNGFGYTVEVTVLQAIRGEKALDYALSENEYNEIPVAGKEYYFAKINIKGISSEKKEPFSPYYGFAFYNDKGVEYQTSGFAYNLGSEFTSILSGGETTGWIYCIVDKSDDIYISNFDSKHLDKIWMKPEKNLIQYNFPAKKYYTEHRTTPDFGAMFNVKTVEVVTHEETHGFIYDIYDFSEGTILDYAHILRKDGFVDYPYDDNIAFKKGSTIVVLDINAKDMLFGVLVVG